MKIFINRNNNMIGIIENDDGSWIQTPPIMRIEADSSTMIVHCKDDFTYMVGYGEDIEFNVN